MAMASSVFTFCQPQVAVACSHLTTMVGSVRAMSSHKEARIRERNVLDKEKKVTAAVSQLTASIKERHEQNRKNNSTEPEVCQQVEPVQLSELSVLLRDTHNAVTTPTTALVQQARTTSQRNSLRWSECHTSAQSFFENKTGFPLHQLEASYPLPLPGLFMSARNTLFRKIFNSLVHSQYSQQRGFKTRRGDKKSGMGSGTRGDKERPSGMQDILSMFSKNEEPVWAQSTKSQPINQATSRVPLGSIHEQSAGGESSARPNTETDPKLKQQLRVAFAEGYEAREKNHKKNDRNWRNVVMFGFFLYALYWWNSNKSGGTLGFLTGMSPEVKLEDINVTFADVKGASEAKQELQDVVNFLRDPEKYTALGAKLPKGVLLVGPPGVGKTLLARAVAGEADVPFFHASGSEFDELFVGLGAKRIRQLFASAKEQAPCIIFIDEFDSVGAKRTSSAVHPYANQTVNQLLNEMDGFQQNEGIIVMGATNKVDNMDKALRRPGRFDVEVVVALPDLKDRKEILELYISKIKKDPTVDVDKLAKGTTGFSGAELENLINQAALKAVIEGEETVSMAHLEHARDKIIMGPERKNRIPDEETNWNTAFHEAGHTLVAYYTPDATPLHKVTIIPRGQSLGHTAFRDDKEVYQQTVSKLKATLDVAMGGRAAEELINGTEKVTTGASSDLQAATQAATAMVMMYGMSDKVGLRSFAQRDLELSPAQRETIDNEIKRLLQESYERAKSILKQHQQELNNLAKALMEHETLDKDDIKRVCEGKKLTRPL